MRNLGITIDVDKLDEAVKRIEGSEPELAAAGRFVSKIKRREMVLEIMKKSVPFQYTIYIPSKLNPVRCSTPKLLLRQEIPFKLIIEPQDKEIYTRNWGQDNLLILPDNNRGLSFSRNFIKDHSLSLGEQKHWQLDDDIGGFSICDSLDVVTSCNASRVFAMIEDECSKFSNVAIAGPSNQCFSAKGKSRSIGYNKLVASCFLIDNSFNQVKWEIDKVEDIDFCLGVLSAGWCTMKFSNALFGKGADLQVSGNYNAMDTYKQAVRTIMLKWPGVFTLSNTGRLRSRVWAKFTHMPINKSPEALSKIIPRKGFGLY